MIVRIPAEVLSPYLTESDSKTSETKKAEPVDGAAKLRAALSETFPDQRQAVDGEEQSAGNNAERSGQIIYRRRKNDQRNIQERRQEERRQQNLPILLDTRLTRCRRKMERHSVINLKI